MERMAQFKEQFNQSRWAAFFLLTCGWLATSRALFETGVSWWIGQPVVVAGFLLLLAGVIWRYWHGSITPLLPLLLGVSSIVWPNATPLARLLWWGGSLWLTAVCLLHHHHPQTSKGWLLFIPLALLPLYLSTMPVHVGQADTFEFQVVANQLGIAHPTGYPLYLLLGKLAIILNPFGSVALRLNLATMLYGLLASGFVFMLAYQKDHSAPSVVNLNHPLIPLLGAISLGLTPTFWSQAIEAEVYTLHALFIAGSIWLMGRIIQTRQPNHLFILLAFVIGLGLTNHLTTVFLLPPTGLLALWLWRKERLNLTIKLIGQCGLAFIAPLSLYAYLPLRWQAVNHEPMGWARFIDWVVGGRFQGALQWRAWLDDPTRYAVVGRLFEAEWGVLLLFLAVLAVIWLALYENRQLAMVLTVTWLGYSFYALNYYVPDLNVFLIPAHVTIAIALGHLPIVRHHVRVGVFLGFVLCLFLPTHYAQVTQVNDDGLEAWGRAVLERPLAPNSTILADSEKIAPLYYLQQVENIRPDLEIMVLPDETAYRAEMTQRVQAGETVYLARFIPNVPYAKWSEGPLTAVSLTPPTSATPQFTTNQTIEGITLHGYDLFDWIPQANGQLQKGVTLHWQTTNPIEDVFYIYVRWQGEQAIVPEGRHLVNGDYPTNAWQAGQWVSDFHVLPVPILAEGEERPLQIALAPPFTQPDELEWHTIGQAELPASPPLQLETLLEVPYAHLDFTLTGVTLPTQARPQTPVSMLVNGVWQDGRPFALQQTIIPEQIPCHYNDLSSVPVRQLCPPEQPNIVTIVPATMNLCGWLGFGNCTLGQIEINGVPLPEGAINYDDQIALLDLDVPSQTLTRGGMLDLTLRWQALSDIPEDYTVFVQLLDEQGALVAQIDAWPLQGTYPTSQWQSGETINDPYQLTLPPDLPAGNYQLIVGWYLLADLRRLPVLSADGVPLDDKFSIEGLIVPQED